MEALLEKTRTINKLLQNGQGGIDYELMAQVLSENIGANIYLVGRRGKILGYHFVEEFTCPIMSDILLHSESFPESYNQQLLMVTETQDNIRQNADYCIFNANEKCQLVDKRTTIIPIYGGGDRLGSMILTKAGADLGTDDLVLAEHGATVVGMEILRIKNERVESDTKKKAAVQIALGTLSFSEMEAAGHIFSELGGSEGLLVASRIADRVGITRSVIVNALRKLESAGVIEAKSLGMKGTFIRILNDNLLDELKKVRWNKKIR